MNYWMDGLSSDSSFVPITISNNEGSKLVSRSGLLQEV